MISTKLPDLTDSSTPEIPALGCSYRERAGPDSSIARRPGLSSQVKGLALILTSVPCLHRAGFTGKGQGLNPQGGTSILTPLPCQDRLDCWFQERGWSSILTLFIPGNMARTVPRGQRLTSSCLLPSPGQGRVPRGRGEAAFCKRQALMSLPSPRLKYLHWPVLWGRGGASSDSSPLLGYRGGASSVSSSPSTPGQGSLMKRWGKRRGLILTCPPFLGGEVPGEG